MLEVKKEIMINKSLDLLLSYFMNPRNIMKYIPYFKEIHQINENTFKVTLKWLFSVDFEVIRIFQKSTNEITYLVNRDSIPRIHAQLTHFLASIKQSTKVIIIFKYQGPFEFYVRREAQKFLENLNDKIFEELSELNMIVIKEGVIKDDKFKDVIDLASIESVNSETELVLSDGDTIVRISFNNGKVIRTLGDINLLRKGEIKYLIKKKI
ncbi:STK_08120 family protein [Sulfurisphaera ohwakuensis]|uniref:Uncharacterized protein n=1 Tax=Sulfurisphaera ohwakuensis TaxID=69656 RepID=A0A650CG27_SULOH|nr:hypothetical protein [Sulfurisphaera ohwakuensis]MBB5254491.1 hypothetical protein [Sulfurisphaera ohwakuensis]QGR16706.1 hypothetical protein D1869_05530 [Sulfurisphaera ohwakuensis]